eukprot:SAG25_NODE_197_length_12126_cov_39.030515_7_plen_47_part_00
MLLLPLRVQMQPLLLDGGTLPLHLRVARLSLLPDGGQLFDERLLPS